MSGRRVMEPAEGSAWRVQLDAAWTVLASLEVDARKHNDHEVLNLIKGLDRARRAARAIEGRQEAGPARTTKGT